MTIKDLTPNQLAQKCIDTMLSEDQCSKALGIRLTEVEVGYAKMQMKIRKDMTNGYNVAHGGIIFTLADSTFACACNGRNQITVASGCSIEFLRPALSGDILNAIGKERKVGKKNGVCDIEVFNQKNQLVALFRGKSFITDKSILK